ncbi:MAG: DUF3226 domain-containing protein [Anaerolineales bacterium]
MKFTHRILVEGRNDQYVLRDLLRTHHIDCMITDRRDWSQKVDTIGIVQPKGSTHGITGLLDYLKVILDDGDLECLGIVVDADTNIEGRWRSLCNLLSKFGGRDLPQSPEPEGTIVMLEQRYRKLPVGVWVMPDNHMPGILEDFIGFLIPNADEPLWHRARHCVDDIPKAQRHFSDVDIAKVYVHTWLAWQEEPGRPLGQAITAKYLDAHAPHALRLVRWVERLFEIERAT